MWARKLLRILVGCPMGLLLGGLSAVAESNEPAPFTVQALYTDCKQPISTYEFSVCRSYIAGVEDTKSFIDFASNLPTPGTKTDKELKDIVEALAKKYRSCSPASYGAAVQAFTNWAEQNPSHWGETAVQGVFAALKANWPCL